MLNFFKDLITYIKTPAGFFVLLSVVIAIITILVSFYLAHKNNKLISRAGRGGNAKVVGNNSTAIGGKGGGSGSGGKGGDGGDTEGFGDNVFSMGGEGGEAGQVDRGGRGGRGPLHALMEDYPNKAKEIFDTFGITEEMAKKIGKGGDGAGPFVQEIQKQKFEENRKSYLDSRNSNK